MNMNMIMNIDRQKKQSPKYVTADIMGGLGNQLYQVFAAMAYSMQHNVPFVFPYSDKDKTGTRPTYWHSLFRELMTTNTIDKTQWEQNLSSPDCQMIDRYNIHHYVPLDVNQKPIIRLHGYFQSYKYFEAYQDEIFQRLKLSEQQAAIRAEYFLALIEPENKTFETTETTISMHFRLGDYKHLSYYHNILEPSYYKDALQHIIENLTSSPSSSPSSPKIKILYFCEAEDNDAVQVTINECKTMWPSCTFVKVDDTIEDWKQMLIMSCCDHHIIANSTFSWFGAYFHRIVDSNENSYPMVIYPKKWFGPYFDFAIMTDMFPEHWIQK